MTVSVYQQHVGPYGRVMDWEYVIDVDHWGEPSSAALFIDGVEVDGEVPHEEMMRVWSEHLKRELEEQAEAMCADS